MEFKINTHILSLPPHISTSWENIQSIGMERKTLQIILADGTVVEIPNLEKETINKIFAIHAEVLESDTPYLRNAGGIFSQMTPHQIEQMGDNMFQIGFTAVDELGSVMRHNPAQSDAPDLPPYVIEKIGALAKAMAPEDVSVLPKAEPNCNCMHCQIARAIIVKIQGETLDRQDFIDEEISEEDLTFQQWDIKQTDESMFVVVNKLDTHEHYNVFLGSPVGCTCGKSNCEHIVAVLKS